jgi:four helix bundle protein
MARFQQLRVWQLANEIAVSTYRHLNGLRGEFALCDQIKRAAVSVVSNIAEGSERQSDAEFRQFLIIARASAGELNAQYIVLRDCGLMSAQICDTIIDRLDHCGRMLSNLIAKIESRRRK